MFNETFTNSLTQDSPFTTQPVHIETPLRIHQLAALYSMKEKERLLQSGLQIENSDEILYSNYAFLGDRVGVGKTLMVLGHISQMSTNEEENIPMRVLHPKSTRSCFSLTLQKTSGNLFNSLIVVPHTIFRQWQDTCSKNTSLKSHFLKSQRDLDKDSFLKNLREAHLTLVSNTLLSGLIQSLKAREIIDPTWKRIFYDEADSIKITSNCPVPTGHMTWYITATFPNFLFANQYYHSYVLRMIPEEYLETLSPVLRDQLKAHIVSHPSLIYFKTVSQGFFQESIRATHPMRSHLVIRNSEEFLNTSVQLPPILTQIIRCQAPLQHRLVESAISPETANMLHAGDIQGALESLGVPAHTPLTITEAVTEYKQKEVNKLKRLLVFKEEEEYSTPHAKETAISSLKDKIKGLEEQIEKIKMRVQEASRSMDCCAICFDPPTEPVITPCCSKIFCALCILSWMSKSTQCALCRTSFHPNQLCAISDKERVGGNAKANVIELPKKIDALLDIFKKNPNGKFLVFSRYENPLHTINVDGLTIASLSGNKDVIAKMLSDFESNKVNILLLNSRNAAAGMNISSATHVILLHKMANEEEKQIIGRAYRMGRKDQLHFIHLLHENE